MWLLLHSTIDIVEGAATMLCQLRVASRALPSGVDQEIWKVEQKLVQLFCLLLLCAIITENTGALQ